MTSKQTLGLIGCRHCGRKPILEQVDDFIRIFCEGHDTDHDAVYARVKQGVDYFSRAMQKWNEENTVSFDGAGSNATNYAMKVPSAWLRQIETELTHKCSQIFCLCHTDDESPDDWEYVERQHGNIEIVDVIVYLQALNQRHFGGGQLSNEAFAILLEQHYGFMRRPLTRNCTVINIQEKLSRLQGNALNKILDELHLQRPGLLNSLQTIVDCYRLI